jgi:hypothetical protein
MPLALIIGISLITFLLVAVVKTSGSTGGVPAPPPVPGALTPTAKVGALSQAIAFSGEGYGVPGAIPTRANNPGDLALGNVGGGVVGTENITVFPDATTGWNRLYNQVFMMLNGQSANYNVQMDFYDMGHVWVDGPNAPTITPQANSWSENVAGRLGVDPTTILQDWLNS